MGGKGTKNMVLDIIVILLIGLMGVWGYRKGFVHTLIHTVGWVGSLVIAYLLVPSATAWAKENTGLYDWLSAVVTAKFDVSLTAIEAAANSLPESIAPVIGDYSTSIIDGVATQFTQIFGTIIIFVALFILIKLLSWLILHFFSKDYNDGVVNFADGLFGLLLGFAKGFLLVLVILAALLPVVNLVSTGLVETITSQLASSHIAGYLYNENFILMLIQNYLG